MRPNGRPGAGHGVAHNIGESSGSGAHGWTSRRARVAESFPAPLAAPHGAPDDDYVEITLDVRMDSVSVHSLKPSADLKLLAQKLAKRPASHEAAGRGGFLLRDASTRLKQAVSRELRRPRGSQLGADDKPKSAAAHALKGLNFIRRADDDGPANSWAAVASRFDKHAVDGFLHRSYFGECIGMLPETEQRQGTQRPGGRGKGLQITAKKANQGEIAFAGKLFDALARRRCIASDSISKDELYEFWDILSDTSLNHSRLQIFFDMMDKNADGRITEEDIKEIITLSASANNLTKVREQSKQYARIIMEELDPEDVGNIEMYQLEMLLQVPISQSTTNSRNLSQILTDELRPTTKPNPSSPPQWYFMEETWRRCWVMLLWLSICMSLFVWKFVQYRRHAVFEVMGYCVCVAKGGAEMLKFNMALILLPVCRNTITWFRNSTTAGRFVPFDDNLNFHKVIALGVSLAAGLHVISHLTCDFPRLLHATKEEYQPMIPFFGKEKPPNYWWFIKGTEGWTGLVMLVLMAITFTLATPWFRTGKLRLPEPLKRLIGFNAFWYSHHLFVIVYGLLLVHGHFLYLTKTWQNKSTWMYLAVPMVIYACERLTRALRSSVWPVKIRKVAVYPGNVLSLYFSKPRGFRYKSGQYIFVKCGAVSQFQWHPFSITSSPNDDYVSVHIRTAGDWTSDLKKVFSKACKPPTDGKSGLLRAEFNDGSGTSNSSLPKVVIDGPYGAPAQDYTQYDIVLLVGLGIGATPMISIIKDIINNVNNPGTSAAASFRTRRAYFYWVTREQGSFEWFHGVMDEVAETDKRSVIEFNSYLTSVHEAGDAMSTPIAVLQSLNHAKHGVDVVSGTRVKTHFGRPNWRDVYKRIAFHHRHQRVGVFYCGAPPLVKELRGLAQEFSTKTSTKFEFHKENF